MFVGAVAVLGAGVRVVRASSGEPSPAMQPALDHQVRSADSAAAASTRGRGRGRGRGTGGRAAQDTTKHRRGTRAPRDSTPRPPLAPMDRKGWINGRLDLDVATAAQIDSLPGVTPAMARRIVIDRHSRGPFLTLDGLRRVSGAGPAFVARLDSLVTFSGTVEQPEPADTVIPPRRRSRPKAAVSAAARPPPLPVL